MKRIKRFNESLPRESTVKQLKRLRKLTKGVDIGDRISDMNKEGSNIQYISNPIDTGIESYEDFEKHNKKFVPGWNMKSNGVPFSDESKPNKGKKNFNRVTNIKESNLIKKLDNNIGSTMAFDATGDGYTPLDKELEYEIFSYLKNKINNDYYLSKVNFKTRINNYKSNIKIMVDYNLYDNGNHIDSTFKITYYNDDYYICNITISNDLLSKKDDTYYEADSADGIKEAINIYVEKLKLNVIKLKIVK